MNQKLDAENADNTKKHKITLISEEDLFGTMGVCCEVDDVLL